MDGVYDATIAVVADEDAARRARARRAGTRRSTSAPRASSRRTRRRARATYAVRNDGTDAELESELAVILETA